MKLYCIPNIKQIEEYIQISEEKELAFEYNDFFSPDILDDVSKKKEILRCYQSINRDRSRDTLHGVFLDITVHSSDAKIMAVSDERIHQSMEVAEELGVRAVIFHTNLIPQLRTASYEESWLQRNEIYWKRLLEEYPKREIYIENMFDYDARMITAPLQYCLANKFLVELDRQVKDIMGIKQEISIHHKDLEPDKK